MPKNLVIVESPAKAKTIEKYLGTGFKVISSMGHIRDLIKGNHAIDIENKYQPVYQISPDKKETVRQLKKLSKEVDTVYLASDDDREGEAISWHLKEALDLKEEHTRRIVFTEITKKAIQNALKTPRGINIDLVNSQQARRVLDRLVGFELSPILWKKIQAGLSAGRVQSVAVRLIVEREREIEKFKTTSAYKLSAVFNLEKGSHLIAGLPEKLEAEKNVLAFMEPCKEATFTIGDLQKKPVKKKPAPPFITSTLQQEAGRKLSFSVSQTMAVAQKLYEAGKISYMRTDSLNLSQEAIEGAQKQITDAYGKEFAHTRRYKTKSSNAQEAHEAIRPTDFSVTNPSMDRNANRLYELIWQRAIASQMADARLERTTVAITISNHPKKLSANGEVLLFEGFLKVYLEHKDEDSTEEDSKVLPPLTIGQVLDLKEMKATETFTRHPARYAEAGLVKKLEELGIGRPSTYAPTISTIQKRGYVLKESREGKMRNYQSVLLKNKKIDTKTLKETAGTEKNKLFPTNTAMIVNDFLVRHFPTITDYSFTANIEAYFDEIAKGKLEWQKMIDQFYKPFHTTVSATEKVERSSVANKVRKLGVDPKTGLNVYAKLGKYGAYAQLGENPEEGSEQKPRYAGLRQGQFLENIEIDEALTLFKLPREVAKFEEMPVMVNIGRFGPYVLHNKKFVSIPKEEDPYTITGERATELIKDKRVADANKTIKSFDENEDVQVLNGRYGPYIKAGTKNVKIPKNKKPSSLTLEECLELAEKAPESKRRFVKRKKK